MTTTATPARAVLDEAAEAVAGAARDLGHDLHPWPPANPGAGLRITTGCRFCGMTATASVGFAALTPYGEGAATMIECPRKEEA